MDEDNQIISRYTRAQAIEEGVLVDVSEQAKETGLLLPTVITDHVHHVLENIPRARARIIVAGFTMFSGRPTSSCAAPKARGSKRTIFLPNFRSLSTPRRIHCGLMQTVTVSPSCTQRTTDASHDVLIKRTLRCHHQR